MYIQIFLQSLKKTLKHMNIRFLIFHSTGHSFLNPRFRFLPLPINTWVTYLPKTQVHGLGSSWVAGTAHGCTRRVLSLGRNSIPRYGLLLSMNRLAYASRQEIVFVNEMAMRTMPLLQCKSLKGCRYVNLVTICTIRYIFITACIKPAKVVITEARYGKLWVELVIRCSVNPVWPIGEQIT